MARYTDKVPEIKHIDMYSGQLDNPKVDDAGNPHFEGFLDPALFIEFPPVIDLKPLAMRRKTAEIIFSTHIFQRVTQTIDRRTPAAIRAKGHAHKQLIDKVQYFTEGFNGNNVVSGFNQFDAISWVGMRPYIFMGMYMVDVLNFKVKLTSDNSRITYTPLASLVPPILSANDVINSEMDDLDPETL
jgi:hypothetical protein